MQSRFRRYECQYLNNSNKLTCAGRSHGQPDPRHGKPDPRRAGRVGLKLQGKTKATASGQREDDFNRICCDTNCEGEKKATAADTEDTEERMISFLIRNSQSLPPTSIMPSARRNISRSSYTRRIARTCHRQQSERNQRERERERERVSRCVFVCVCVCVW